MVVSIQIAEEFAEATAEHWLFMQVAVESTQPVEVVPAVKAATRACREIALAATAGQFTAAEVASAPTAEELTEVAAELQPTGRSQLNQSRCLRPNKRKQFVVCLWFS